MTNRNRDRLLTTLTLLVCIPLRCISQVPQQPVPSDSLEEIVVTAQKREERLIDVPISIEVVSGEELKERRITSLEDLPQVVPDLAYNNYGNNHYFEIRGVSNLIGNSPLIGIYIDEADVTLGGAAVTQISPTVFDLERVEVLRGPQGTLYGEGSAGGTIRFITRNPDLKAATFDTDVAALFTEGGEPSQRINAVANIPLIDGQLGVRIAGVFQHDGGWINQPAADLTNINAQNLTNVRVKALWQVTPQFSVSLMTVINRSERGLDITDSGNRSNYTQVFNLTTTPRVTNNYDLYNITLGYEFDNFKVLNTSTYMQVDAPWTNQSGRFPFAPPGTFPLYDYYAPIQNTFDNVFTDELRVSSLSSSPWQWTIGAFYRRYLDSTSIPLNYFGEEQPPGTPLPEPYAFAPETIYKSKSGFFDSSYRFFDRFTVGTGARYFSDHQDFTDHAALTQQSTNFSSIDPRVYAQFKITNDFNVYTSAAKGFRSGGFNSADEPAYTPEHVWTYELGAKTLLLDGRVSIDSSLFWSNYSDYQTFGITNAQTGENFIANVGSARIKGIEWDLGYLPVKELHLDVRGDYLNARFTAIRAENADYAVGDPLDQVPRYQITTSARYDYRIRTKAGFVRLDYSQQGPETYRNRSVGDFYYGESNVIRMLNFNTTLFWSEDLQVGVFAQNLLDEHGFANPLNFVADGVRPRPRTYGLSFSASFH